MTEPLTLYKLIVLYMLRQIDFSMTLSQISDFVNGKGYTDYFTLQSAISELMETELVHCEHIQNTSFYTITPEGEEAIGYFENQLSHALKQDIIDYLKENRLQLRDEVSVLSEYYRNTSGEYDAVCRVREKNADLIRLTVSVPEEKQAKMICRQWKEKCQNVYAYVMKELMTEE